MKKVVWRDNQVISLELRHKDEAREENVYCLAQMIDGCYLLIFDIFNTDNNWENISLEAVPILFCTAIARGVYRVGNAYRQDIKPLYGYHKPTRRINSFSASHRYVTLWEGTPDEMQVCVLGTGGGELIEGDFGKHKVIIPDIPFSDNETIDRYELTNLGTYPDFQERLYLCYLFGRNVDPLKDLIFGRPIPIEYKDFMKAYMSLL